MKHRYIPFVQQPYCCVPACFQAIMYKHGLPLLPQEELANELGLVVPEADTHMFNNVRSGQKPSSGWGTQVQKEEYSPNRVFRKLGIQLKFRIVSNKDLGGPAGLKNLLHEIEISDQDALLCFDYGNLWNTQSNGGHVCVFDRIKGNQVYIIDPERNVPKYRATTIDKLFDAMDSHGEYNAAGVWIIEKA